MGEPGHSGNSGKRTGIRAGASLVAIVAVGLVALLAQGCGEDSGDSSTRASTDGSTNAAAGSPAGGAAGGSTGPLQDDTSPPEPEFITVGSLREAAEKQKTPIYWAGEQPGTRLVLSPLTKGSLGNTFVRYVPGGGKAYDPGREFLTIVTILSANPAARLKSLAQGTGDTVGKAPGGASIYYDRSRPESIYLAFPGVDAEIEVFYPDHFRQALQLVNSGQIVPVG